MNRMQRRRSSRRIPIGTGISNATSVYILMTMAPLSYSFSLPMNGKITQHDSFLRQTTTETDSSLPLIQEVTGFNHNDVGVDGGIETQAERISDLIPTSDIVDSWKDNELITSTQTEQDVHDSFLSLQTQPTTTIEMDCLCNTTKQQEELILKRSIDPPIHRLEDIARRAWLARVAGAVLVGGTAVGGGTMMYLNHQNQTITTKRVQQQKQAQSKKLAPINVTQVVRETGVNISVVEGTRSTITLDSKTFQKNRQYIGYPGWLPSSLIPPPKVIKNIPNSELLSAAIVAGSLVEMIRTTLLYPLQTLKTRIQADLNRRQQRTRRRRNDNIPKYNGPHWHIRRRIRIVQLNALRHVREGNLYVGLIPSLLISVPATGVYYGARDITKRMLILMSYPMGETSITLIAVFVADVISLIFRTPADTLTMRLQVASGQEGKREYGTDNYDNDDVIAKQLADALVDARIDARVGNWFVESLQRTPTVILTDVPYLLSRITLNNAILHGQSMDIGHYEIASLASAVMCAFLTTPLDVARTRILVDSDNDVTNGIDGGSNQDLFATMRSIVKDANGDIGCLFAGWLERTVYLGICSLWLPFALVLYVAIRDAILLEWFD